MVSLIAAAFFAIKVGAPVSTFKITLTGFKCNEATIDNALDLDGIGDEIYIVVDSAMIGPGGKAFGISRRRSVVYGDVAHHPERIQAGSRSRAGGISDGDQVPASNPYASTPSFTGKLPMLVGMFTAKEGSTLVAVCPSVWESDGSGTNYGHYDDTVSSMWKSGWAEPTTSPANILPRTNWRSSAMPKMAVDLSGDYPVGTTAIRTPAGIGYLDHYSYEPKVVYFTQERMQQETGSARQLSGPVGTVEVGFIDKDLRGIYDRHTGVTTMFSTGRYTLYLLIERM